MLVYVRYNKDKFQYDLTNQYFRASVTPGPRSYLGVISVGWASAQGRPALFDLGVVGFGL